WPTARQTRKFAIGDRIVGAIDADVGLSTSASFEARGCMIGAIRFARGEWGGGFVDAQGCLGCFLRLGRAALRASPFSRCVRTGARGLSARAADADARLRDAGGGRRAHRSRRG